MVFTETGLQGTYLLDMQPHRDERGFFARTWCQKEFRGHGLTSQLAQVNISGNAKAGTLRGLHYQAAPYQDAKVVSCIRGALYDVVLDLRPDSPTYLRWYSAELTAANHRLLYIPEGCAHGFQTLVDETEVLYLMSEFYSPEHARGVPYNDPAFGIRWPLAVQCISHADQTWPAWSGGQSSRT